MTHPPLRTLIADDECHARQRLDDLLRPIADFDVVARCDGGRSAQKALEHDKIDVAFLDIRMPHRDGLSLLRDAGASPAPLFVFVTAHAEHAVDAFEVEAVDYLLKPFDDTRFARSLERLRHASAESPRPRSPEPRTAPLHTPLAVRSGGITTLLGLDEILWIEGDGTYVRVHTEDDYHLHRKSMRLLEAELQSSGFMRVHRSAIVRLAAIRTLTDQALVLKNGVKIRVSERQRAPLLRALGL